MDHGEQIMMTGRGISIGRAMRTAFALRVLLALCLLLPMGAGFAQALAPIPAMDAPVVDTTGTLDADTRARLDAQAHITQDGFELVGEFEVDRFDGDSVHAHTQVWALPVNRMRRTPAPPSARRRATTARTKSASAARPKARMASAAPVPSPVRDRRCR